MGPSGRQRKHFCMKVPGYVIKSSEKKLQTYIFEVLYVAKAIEKSKNN